MENYLNIHYGMMTDLSTYIIPICILYSILMNFYPYLGKLWVNGVITSVVIYMCIVENESFVAYILVIALTMGQNILILFINKKSIYQTWLEEKEEETINKIDQIGGKCQPRN